MAAGPAVALRRFPNDGFPTDGSAMLDKTYRPDAVEPRHYAAWERAGCFAADPRGSKRPYTIMMPPPNVTGSLHMGHALTFTCRTS
jgi:isoleucyl-tRNA synthetase